MHFAITNPDSFYIHVIYIYNLFKVIFIDSRRHNIYRFKLEDLQFRLLYIHFINLEYFGEVGIDLHCMAYRVFVCMKISCKFTKDVYIYTYHKVGLLLCRMKLEVYVLQELRIAVVTPNISDIYT